MNCWNKKKKENWFELGVCWILSYSAAVYARVMQVWGVGASSSRLQILSVHFSQTLESADSLLLPYIKWRFCDKQAAGGEALSL